MNIKKIVISVMICVLLSLGAFATTNYDNTVIVPTLVNQQPDPVQPGNYVELRFRIDNIGQRSQDYTFELLADYPFSFDNPQDAIKDVRIGSGEAGSGATVLYFRVRVDENAVEGQQNNIQLKYHPKSNPNSFVIYEQPIRIESQRGLVQVGDIQLIPENPQVGTQFMLNVGIENLGNSFIENVRVRLDTDDSGFRPVGSSNEKTIQQIPATQTHMVGFSYFIDANTDVTVHQIPVTLTYVDSKGEERTTTTKIGIPVGAEPSYVTNLQNTEVLMANQNGRITVSISNTGKSDMNFAHLELRTSDEYVILNSPSSYLGNLLSDDFETAQFTIYTQPTNAESIPLNFQLTYRDSYYAKYTDNFTLDLRLYDTQTAQNLGLIPKQSYSGLIVLVLIIAGVVGFIVYKKRKKSKMQ